MGFASSYTYGSSPGACGITICIYLRSELHVLHWQATRSWRGKKCELVWCGLHSDRESIQDITSIAVHPAWPYMFLTTSRDLSTRLYNLSFTPRQVPNNPHWPPNTQPSLAGSAFGMHSSESEGDGLGRCVGVLVGNRSGGHEGAVLHVVGVTFQRLGRIADTFRHGILHRT